MLLARDPPLPVEIYLHEEEPLAKLHRHRPGRAAHSDYLSPESGGETPEAVREASPRH